MLVGILSDSHNKHLAVRQALGIFDKLEVSHLIHCGDVGGENVFTELAERACTFVWGNTDFPSAGLQAYAKSLGFSTPHEIPTIVELNSKRIAVFHGHEPGFDRAPYELEVDYICHGHTHIANDHTINGVRIINPGALHRAARKTVATLDTSTDELKFYGIDES